MKQRQRAWLWFAATAIPLLAVLAWLTATLIKVDRDEVMARRQAQLHERLRLALWRMDSWLSPQLAREALRPPGHYRSFGSPTMAWSRGYAKLSADDVLVQSPLLGVEDAVFALHFEVTPDGLVHSPQVPTGNQRDACEANGVDPAILRRAEARLEALRPRLSLPVLDERIGGAERLLPMMGCNPVAATIAPQAQQSVAELNNRQRNFVDNVSQGAAPRNAPAEVGDAVVAPMVPFWLEGTEPLLVFGRRVRDASGMRLQGVVVDWPALQQRLVSLAHDLFESGCTEIVRCDSPATDEQASMLATVPARLQAHFRDTSLPTGLPTMTILGVTWGVVLLGLGVLAFTLRAAIGFGERRARFASAVTHELRTPLTTFRMYSEMLADGVVTDPVAKQEYLATLQRESDRLSRVVENVLAWSRLEEGRFTSRRERHGVAALVDRVVPILRRRLLDAGMVLQVRISDAAHDVVLATDEDAIGQILFNLVDNAAKYGKGTKDLVELLVDVRGGDVTFAVRDHGPGVPAGHRRGIFAPFDRGDVPVSSNDVPGTGLGLPLARGLARDLGGDLVLDEGVRDGACFVLRFSRSA